MVFSRVYHACVVCRSFLVIHQELTSACGGKQDRFFLAVPVHTRIMGSTNIFEFYEYDGQHKAMPLPRRNLTCLIICRTLLGEEGWPKDFIKKVPLYLSVFSTGHNRLLRSPLVWTKKLIFAVAQRFGKGLPAVAGAETWAFKNTMLAVQVSVSQNKTLASAHLRMHSAIHASDGSVS